jgi:hypothetical protein
MQAADISSHSIIFMLLALTVPITANPLSIKSGFFLKLVKGNTTIVMTTIADFRSKINF